MTNLKLDNFFIENLKRTFGMTQVGGKKNRKQKNERQEV